MVYCKQSCRLYATNLGCLMPESPIVPAIEVCCLAERVMVRIRVIGMPRVRLLVRMGM